MHLLEASYVEVPYLQGHAVNMFLLKTTRKIATRRKNFTTFPFGFLLHDCIQISTTLILLYQTGSNCIDKVSQQMLYMRHRNSMEAQNFQIATRITATVQLCKGQLTLRILKELPVVCSHINNYR
jgi:hypothetical protein